MFETSSFSFQVPEILNMSPDLRRVVARKVVMELRQGAHSDALPAGGGTVDVSTCLSMVDAVEAILRQSGRTGQACDILDALTKGGFRKFGTNPYQQLMITVGSNGGRLWRHGEGLDAVIGLEERQAASSRSWK